MFKLGDCSNYQCPNQTWGEKIRCPKCRHSKKYTCASCGMELNNNRQIRCKLCSHINKNNIIHKYSKITEKDTVTTCVICGCLTGRPNRKCCSKKCILKHRSNIRFKKIRDEKIKNNKKCKWCGVNIPLTKQLNANFCSVSHYHMFFKQGRSRLYNKKGRPHKQLNKTTVEI